MVTGAVRRSISDLARVGLGATLAATLLMGCSVSVNENKKPKEKQSPAPAARVVEDGTHVWDLRAAPTRADAGVKDGEDTAAYYGADDLRQIRLRLPEGVTLTMKAQVLTFQAILSFGSKPDANKPSGLDASTGLLPRSEAYEQFKTNLEQIGAPTSTADRWFKRTEGAQTDDPNEWSPIGAGESRDIGYAGLSVGARFSPASGKAKIVWTMYWGPKGQKK